MEGSAADAESRGSSEASFERTTSMAGLWPRISLDRSIVLQPYNRRPPTTTTTTTTPKRGASSELLDFVNFWCGPRLALGLGCRQTPRGVMEMRAERATLMHPSDEEHLSIEERLRALQLEIERLERLRQFVSPQVAAAILSEEVAELLRSHRRDVVVTFFDLR